MAVNWHSLHCVSSFSRRSGIRELGSHRSPARTATRIARHNTPAVTMWHYPFSCQELVMRTMNNDLMLLKDEHARGSRLGATESNGHCKLHSRVWVSDLPVSGQCWARVCLVSTDLCGLSVVPRPRRCPRCSVARALCSPPDTTCPSWLRPSASAAPCCCCCAAAGCCWCCCWWRHPGLWTQLSFRFN